MKRAINKPLSIVLATIILTCIALPVTGASAADFLGGVRQLKVEVKYGQSAVSSIEVGIYRVATLTVSGGKVRFNLVPEFVGAVDDWSEDMDDITAAELRDLATKLVSHARSNDIERVTDNTDANGVVIFSDLKDGLYLVMQETTTGTRYRFTPSLVPVGREGVVVEVRPKTSWDAPRPSVTPPAPSVTPTPTIPTPTPTPTPIEIPEPTIPGGSFPTPTPVEIPEPTVPGGEFPDGEKPPGKIVQTGVIDFDAIIILLTVFGVLLIVVGIIQSKRGQKDERLPIVRD